MPTTPVKTSVDTHAFQGSPNTNYGPSVRLALNGTGGTDDRRAFLHFPPVPLGATIVSATLKLYTRGAWAGTQTVTAKRITEKWSEGKLTWNKQPAVSATNPGSVVVVGAGDGVEVPIDVTALMGDVSAGNPYFGIRLELSADVLRYFHSAEATKASLRPVLEVEWSEPPDPPQSLAPSGGRAVSGTKPVLAWAFGHPNVSAQTSSQVQVSTTSDFTSPAYDSGKVANTSPRWDLGATAFSALADGDVRWWRVRVWDEADVASEWSDPVSFARQTKGTLTITSPSGGTVADLSPPVVWTFTGETQESYQVRVEEDVGGVWTELHDSGRIVGTTLSYGIPEGLLIGGPDYRVEVRVWDTLDRQAIANDPDYVTDTEPFTYVRSGVPAAVTALTADAYPVAHGPGVELEWTRATAPDYFALMVDGVNVPGYERIDPADVLVSGTSYRMVYWGATPRVAHTYELEAVVISGGVKQHSDGNATDSLTTNSTDIWLVDEDDDLYANLGGQDRADFGVGESGATHYLRGRRDPVVIIDTVRGYEGSISGLLRGKTVRDALLELYARRKVLRLVIGDVTIPVRIRNVAPPPTPLSNDRLYTAAFDFVQVGGYTFEA